MSVSCAVARGSCREADLDVEAAVGAGRRSVMVASWASAIALTMERPRPSPFASRGAGGVESLERLEDPLELARRDLRAGVRDGENGSTVAGLGVELDAAAGDVVADRVAR